jgi:predicted RNA-binding protein with PIN domain
LAYLIDGNNFLGFVSESDFFSGGKSRLIGRLRRLIRVRRTRVHLVFDGPPDSTLADFDDFHGRPLRIYYPPFGLTADDVICKILDKHSDRRTLTVVSSDREIKDYARSRGAKLQTCAQFNRTLKEADRKFHDLRAGEKEEATLSALEMNQWMDLFDSHDKKK